MLFKHSPKMRSVVGGYLHAVLDQIIDDRQICEPGELMIQGGPVNIRPYAGRSSGMRVNFNT